MEENKTLSWEEKIKRIEMAPKEVQTMVAKAFIRDDIPDENVQYKFNSDSIEELNENGMEGVENINAEPTDEGIGAGSFSVRTSKPYDNKNYIRTASGGWNTCIKGNPTDAHADVLANCVGYASGRFNEIINNAREKTGCTYTNLNCNAEYFADRAKADGLEMGSTPRVGAIGCMWGAGDLAGHVFIVEKVYSNSKIYTSESGWGSSTVFWNQTRDNSNGRWGMSGNYSFRCFIYLPSDVQKIVDGGSPTPTPTPSDKFNIGDEVILDGPIYVSSNASSPANVIHNRKTNVTRKNPGSAHPYNTTGDLGWCDESSLTKVEPTPTPTPTPTERKGLDLSSYQAGISFDAIKNSEYNQFVILRGGFTGWGTGVNYNKDSSFETFYSEAKAKGIPVGCYWYSCANNHEKGVAEANYLYENCLKGKQFEYPIYIDVEDSHWQVGNKDGVTAAIKGFCETLEAKKYYVGIYGSDISGFQEKMNINQLNDYDKWVARYGSAPQYVKTYGMWQTSSSGRINGYGDNLDTDIAYKDYTTIIKNAGLNGWGDQPTPPTPPTPTPGPKYAIGDAVVLNGPIYVSSDASSPANTISGRHTNVTRYVSGAKHPYNTTGDLGWCDEGSLSADTPSPTPPAPEPLKVGDKVKIIGTGNGSSYGGSSTAYGIGWTRQILKIWNGRPYPYQVGNASGTTGFYKADALQKV